MAQERTSLNPVEALGYTSLSDTTYLYKPSPSQTNNTNPGLVIICSWAFAQDKHIAKYLTWYKQLYPTSRILLVKSSIHNMMWRPDSWQVSLFEPAVQAVKDYLSSVEPSESRILVHLFSNGGAHTAVQLAQFYAQNSTSELPVNALILDSAPSQANPTLGTKALVQGLPKSPITNIIGPFAARSTLYVSAALHYMGISEFALSKLWRILNDTKGPFLKETVPRTYIYSDADEVIEEADVKLHAQQAIQALETAGSTHAAEKIRCEEFIGTAHVNHMLKNPDRYWGLVKDTWKAAIA